MQIYLNEVLICTLLPVKFPRIRANNNTGEFYVLKENGQTCVIWNKPEAKHILRDSGNRWNIN